MKKILILLTIIAAANLATAQSTSLELVGSSGNTLKNESYQIDFSIGEPVTATQTNGDIKLTQGFHQATYVITSIKDIITEVEMSVFPNPTTDFIQLKVEATNNYIKNLNDIQYTIINAEGKILQVNRLSSSTEHLDFSSKAVGAYLLKIEYNSINLKLFKIVKQ